MSCYQLIEVQLFLNGYPMPTFGMVTECELETINEDNRKRETGREWRKFKEEGK